uniref:Uncharacterized protein n=1 Tax=viral metagenome TaxID=1070528 RepID=A0A6C0H287_9ZZZZ
MKGGADASENGTGNGPEAAAEAGTGNGPEAAAEAVNVVETGPATVTDGAADGSGAANGAGPATGPATGPVAENGAGAGTETVNANNLSELVAAAPSLAAAAPAAAALAGAATEAASPDGTCKPLCDLKAPEGYKVEWLVCNSDGYVEMKCTPLENQATPKTEGGSRKNKRSTKRKNRRNSKSRKQQKSRK